MRVFSPASDLVGLLVEVVTTACDAGTFICGIMVAVVPADNVTVL